jgi:sugar/nucleoside kinase (ribokinase family)
VLHVDGHQPDAALWYAKKCRAKGILTSLDGGGLRSNTHELLAYIDVAVVAERLCQQMQLTPAGMLEYIKARGSRIGRVTLGERGFLWYDETGAVRSLAALPIPPQRIVDTSGAGDVFHGAYVYCISVLREPPLRTRYSIWETRRACRRWLRSRRYASNMATYDDRPHELLTIAQKPAPLVQLTSDPKTLPLGER